MSDYKPARPETFPADRDDPQEERLRALFATAYPPLKRSATLREEVGARIRELTVAVPTVERRWPAFARRVTAPAMAAALLLTALSLVSIQWGLRRPRARAAPATPSPMVRRSPPTGPARRSPGCGKRPARGR